jgi:Chalcone isomerase-like
MRHFYSLMILLATLLVQHVSAAQIEGVNFDDQAMVQGQRLILNGVGLNQQLSEKVFVAALYLPSKQTTLQSINTLQGAKRLELNYLRKVSSKTISRYFTKAMRDSDEKNELMKDPMSLFEFGRIFDTGGDRIAGDRVTIDWIPGKGIDLRLNGASKGNPINNEALYRLLINSLTGPKAKTKMRDGLLGQSTP